MILYDQQWTASVRRRDGHTIDGTAGDCLRAAAATVLQQPPARLRHYAQDHRWWESMRRDARELLGWDWVATRPELLEDFLHWRDQGWWHLHGDLALGCGPSPRGPFWHTAVVSLPSLDLVHDPHPARAGLAALEELLIPVRPYHPAPHVLELPAGAA